MSGEVEKLHLCQIPEGELVVYVCKFVPQPGDKVNDKQLDGNGEEHVLEMPPYCLANIDQVKTNVKAYIETTRDKYLRTLENASDITWLAVQTALEYATRHPVGLRPC